jgi:hypothetical protein
MSKDSFRRILELIQNDLAGERDENTVNLLPIHKFAIFLQFLRTNAFQKSVGSQHHIRVAASAACKHVNSVAKILARLVPKVIYISSKLKVSNQLFVFAHSSCTLLLYFHACCDDHATDVRI